MTLSHSAIQVTVQFCIESFDIPSQDPTILRNESVTNRLFLARINWARGVCCRPQRLTQNTSKRTAAVFVDDGDLAVAANHRRQECRARPRRTRQKRRNRFHASILQDNSSRYNFGVEDLLRLFTYTAIVHSIGLALIQAVRV